MLIRLEGLSRDDTLINLAKDIAGRLPEAYDIDAASVAYPVGFLLFSFFLLSFFCRLDMRTV